MASQDYVMMLVHRQAKSPAPIQGIAHQLKVPLPVVVQPMGEHRTVQVAKVL